MQELLTIGAFARATKLTPKALRLYAELGLLTPAAVDSDSGYRYYRPAQADRARLIAWLRDLDMPLARIAEVLELSGEAAALAVRAHQARLAEQNRRRDRLAVLLIEHLTGRGAEMTTQLRYAGRTDQGLVRPGNEDAVHIGRDVLAVADGMSGPVGHEVSAAAVAALAAWRPSGDLLESLAQTVRSVEQAVRDAAAGTDGGTTLTGLLRTADGRLALVHIGDTRAYRLRRGQLVQLTRDHSHIQSQVDDGTLTPEEAMTHPQRALLSRALTGSGADQPDIATHDLHAGDRYLLASDGLTAVVPGDEIRQVLAGASDPGEAVEALIAAAHRAGAPDNIACVVADAVAPARRPIG